MFFPEDFILKKSIFNIPTQQFQPPIQADMQCKLHGYETNGKVLGKGATAFVYQGRCLSTGEKVAIKEISRLGNITKKQKELLESELVIEFAHENILTLRHEFAQSVNGLHYQYLILDYCNGEDFSLFLKRNKNILPEPEAKYYMTQFGIFLLFNIFFHRKLT